MREAIIIIGIVFMLFMPSLTYSENTNHLSSFIGENNGNNGKTLYVGGDGPNNYTKIQDAINDASNGDTVFVYAGTYHESISVNKSINIVGEYRYGTVIAANEKDAVNITAYGVNITRFTILTLSDEWPCAGIKLFKARYANISDCDIYFSPIGIYVYASDKNKIENCDVGKNSCGIILNLSEGNSFLNCDIHHHLDEGFRLLSSYGNIITDCKIYDNDVGIDIMGTKNVLSLSSITNNKIGIYVSGFFNKITGCDICDSMWGIMIIAGSANIITNNNFCRNDISALFTNAAFNLWLHNYWQGWIFPLPKPTFGFLIWSFREIAIPWLNFDWMPRLFPYRGGEK